VKASALLALVTAILTLLEGCASLRAPTGAEYPGAARADVAACELEGERLRSTQGQQAPAVAYAMLQDSYARVFDACMRSKGYARKAP
jgi:hypothetical protein